MTLRERSTRHKVDDGIVNKRRRPNAIASFDLQQATQGARKTRRVNTDGELRHDLVESLGCGVIAAQRPSQRITNRERAGRSGAHTHEIIHEADVSGISPVGGRGNTQVRSGLLLI